MFALGLIGDGTQVQVAGATEWDRYGAIGTPRRDPEETAPSEVEGNPCHRCGRNFAPELLLRFQSFYLCGACKGDYFQHFAQGTLAVQYQKSNTFTMRAMAKMVDANIFILSWFALFSVLEALGPGWNEDWVYGMTLVVALAAFVSMNAITVSLFGGSLGKRLFRLRVTDRRGNPASVFHAVMRALAEVASIATLGLGYLVNAPSGDRKTLHDYIAFTTVNHEEGAFPWAR